MRQVGAARRVETGHFRTASRTVVGFTVDCPLWIRTCRAPVWARLPILTERLTTKPCHPPRDAEDGTVNGHNDLIKERIGHYRLLCRRVDGDTLGV